MRIPKSILIGNRKWKIRLSKTLIATLDCYGVCYKDDRIIHIDSSQSKSEMEKTLVHELLHAIWPNRACKMKLEEKLIGKLEEPLYKLLKKYGFLKRGPG
jgi:Zn-dependent peptidase ImmA (M78 family)